MSDSTETKEIAYSKIKDFKPYQSFKAPAWCINGHVHTIASSLLHKNKLYEYKHIVLNTPDDDFLELDFIEAGDQSPIAILLHGLEGSSDRYYMSRLAETLKNAGISSLLLNFRSCGTRMNRRLRFYHSGETSDVRFVAEWLRNKFPDRILFSVGFSLGGNVLVKWVGEQKQESLLTAAVAVSTPYDLEVCSATIEQGFNKVYELTFLHTLVRKAHKKRKKYPQIPKFHGKTLRDFDNQITAKLHGFRDADDYYQRASAAPYVQDIRIPTLLIHSKQDPICPIEALPFESIHHNPFIQTVITEKGGHVGFWSKPPGWLNRTISQFLERFTEKKVS